MTDCDVFSANANTCVLAEQSLRNGPLSPDCIPREDLTESLCHSERSATIIDGAGTLRPTRGLRVRSAACWSVAGHGDLVARVNRKKRNPLE